MQDIENSEQLLIKVSVCVVTYNQENYIRQCLQSIVDQKVDFNFEIIVGDDCSTDGTRVIVQEFLNKYPKLIRVVFHEKNCGPLQNFVNVHELAKGKYVAHIDGDDYMLPGKLQAQADCLDNNDDVSFAAHGRILNANGIEKDFKTSNYLEKGNLEYFVKTGNYIMHSSVMVKKEYDLLGTSTLDVIDFNLHIERLGKGLVYYDKRVFGGYRVNNEGVSRSIHYIPKLEAAVEKGLDRALELGVSEEIVKVERLKTRMSYTIAMYMHGGSRAEFKRKIYLEKQDIKFASKKHIILHHLRNYPWLVKLYLWVRIRM
jgi:glycosyltransferase involved in cell wall biosynthesis